MVFRLPTRVTLPQLLKVEREGGKELGSALAAALVEAFGIRACHYASRFFRLLPSQNTLCRHLSAGEDDRLQASSCASTAKAKPSSSTFDPDTTAPMATRSSTRPARPISIPPPPPLMLEARRVFKLRKLQDDCHEARDDASIVWSPKGMALRRPTLWLLLIGMIPAWHASGCTIHCSIAH
eukprot:scaffold1135_cov343-Prasinococcus_capsulatus_cf.AAC.7